MSTSSGRAAEEAAAEYLRGHGYKIIARNWRTRFCEIDIVAERTGAVHFVEVKYRASTAWGGGLDYITPQKLKQMRFAAENWIAKNKRVSDYALSAIELTGSPPAVTQWLSNIE